MIPRSADTEPGRAIHGTRATRATKPIPLADLTRPPDLDTRVLMGTSQVDDSGRVRDRGIITRALGWAPGDRFIALGTAQTITVRRDPAGPFGMSGPGRILLPAPLCRRCGLRLHDSVLLVASLDEDSLYVFPLPVVVRALRQPGIPARPTGLADSAADSAAGDSADDSAEKGVPPS